MLDLSIDLRSDDEQMNKHNPSYPQDHKLQPSRRLSCPNVVKSTVNSGSWVDGHPREQPNSFHPVEDQQKASDENVMLRTRRVSCPTASVIRNCPEEDGREKSYYVGSISEETCAKVECLPTLERKISLSPTKNKDPTNNKKDTIFPLLQKKDNFFGCSSMNDISIVTRSMDESLHRGNTIMDVVVPASPHFLTVLSTLKC